MIIKCYGETHQYLLFMDIEFSQDKLVQFAGLLWEQIEPETYQLVKSINQYITQRICYPFVEYTGITSTFLNENGVTLEDAKHLIFDDFFNEVPLSSVKVISHGLRNDRLILRDNGINLLNVTENGKVTPIDGYCTFEQAKRILKRKTRLKLTDIAEDASYYLGNAHNAFNDAWAVVAVYCYLKRTEYEHRGTDK